MKVNGLGAEEKPQLNKFHTTFSSSKNKNTTSKKDNLFSGFAFFVFLVQPTRELTWSNQVNKTKTDRSRCWRKRSTVRRWRYTTFNTKSPAICRKKIKFPEFLLKDFPFHCEKGSLDQTIRQEMKLWDYWKRPKMKGNKSVWSLRRN